MKETKMELPFQLNRTDRTSLTAQLVAEFRKAIEAGYYRPGDLLPPIRATAEALGVSTIVVRHAINQLKAEGLVNPRFGIGSEVLARNQQVWKGRILFVVAGRTTNFFLSAAGECIRRNLVGAGYIFEQLVVPRISSGCYDDSQLKIQLKDPSLLVINMCDVPMVGKAIASAGVRTFSIEVDGVSEQGPCAIFESKAAVPELVRHCVDAKIKNVIQIGFNHGFADASDEFEAKGISVTREYVGGDLYDDMVIDTVKRGTLKFFERFFAAGRKLPDLFYFTDDHAAEAGFLSLALHGVRVPDDVKVAAFANRGLAPVYPKPVTRLELDAFDAGELLSQYALALLEGKTIPNVRITTRFIAGITC